jgi:hypothetical protein
MNLGHPLTIVHTIIMSHFWTGVPAGSNCMLPYSVREARVKLRMHLACSRLRSGVRAYHNLAPENENTIGGLIGQDIVSPLPRRYPRNLLKDFQHQTTVQLQLGIAYACGFRLDVPYFVQGLIEEWAQGNMVRYKYDWLDSIDADFGEFADRRIIETAGDAHAWWDRPEFPPSLPPNYFNDCFKLYVANVRLNSPLKLWWRLRLTFSTATTCRLTP